MQNNIERYIRLTLLDINEKPQEQIEGKVTGGSISFDGASKFRRNCSSLSVLVEGDEDIIHDDLWALKHKFRLEIGDRQDEEVVYYPQGVFVISSFSKSKSSNNFTVTISGQDKMCLLNGTAGGQLAADHDFGTIEEINENGVSTITKLPLHTIIYQAMQTYGKERPENIVINDLDIDAFELWEYRGSTPIYYILRKSNPNQILNVIFDEKNVQLLNLVVDGRSTTEKLNLNTFKFYSYNTLDKNYNENASVVNYSDIESYVAKIEAGQAAGFHRTPLVYNGDLTLSAGSAFTDLLDKIVQMLGPYEYFYDVDGRFVFQKKNTYTQELFSPKTGQYISPLMSVSQYSYEIDDDKLNTQVSYSPKIDNVKNDFVVWGKKDSGARFHSRCAIDKKPTYYKTMEYYKPFNTVFLIVKDITKWEKESNIIPYVENENGNEYTIVPVKDRAQWTSDTVGADLGWKSVTVSNQWIDGHCKTNDAGTRQHYVTTKNGYKLKRLGNGEESYAYSLTNGQYDKIYTNDVDAGKYYTLIGQKTYRSANYDWRELIYQMATDFYRHNQKDNFYYTLEGNNISNEVKLYPNGVTGYEQYYTDMQAFWRLLYNPDGDWREYYIEDPLIKACRQITSGNFDNLWNNIKGTTSTATTNKTKLINAIRELLDIQVGTPNRGLHNLDEFLTQSNVNNVIKSYCTENTSISFINLVKSVGAFLVKQGITILYSLGKYEDSLKIDSSEDNKDSVRSYLEIINNNQSPSGYLQSLLDACNSSVKTDGLTETQVAAQKKELYYDIELILNYLGWNVSLTAQTASKKATLVNPKPMSADDKYWNRAIHTDPESLLFWFDFLDNVGDLEQYSVPSIGQKIKVENMDTIKTIYYKERPQIQYIVSPEVYEETEQQMAYYPVWIPSNMQTLFVRSTEGISSIDKINDLIYQHSACSEGLGITCMPQWNLQPNTRVRVKGNDYTLDKIQCQLTYNGTMSLNLTKILPSFQ